ncbi:MAG: CHAT domain-containing protein [Polyangiaceae bacterium]|nr:CHAT domain-containing protein [Polyangiaceae bacterium]
MRSPMAAQPQDARLTAPRWPEPADSSFIRGFGGVERRAPSDIAWFGESHVVSAHGVARFPIDSLAGLDKSASVDFRQVSSDGRALVRFDVGLSLGTHDSKTPHKLAALLSMLIEVHRWGHVRPVPLGNSGALLAREYARATSLEKHAPKSTERVIAGKPLLYIELYDPKVQELDFGPFEVTQRMKFPGFDIECIDAAVDGQPVAVFVCRYQANADTSKGRQARNCIVRMHARVEGLRGMLGWLLRRAEPHYANLLDAAAPALPPPDMPEAQWISTILYKGMRKVREGCREAERLSIPSEPILGGLGRAPATPEQVAEIGNAVASVLTQIATPQGSRLSIVKSLSEHATMLAQEAAPIEHFAQPPRVLEPMPQGFLAWNTRLDGAPEAEKKRELVANTIYRLRTELSSKRDIDGLTPLGVAGIQIAPGGEQEVPVRFRMSARGAGLRAVGRNAEFASEVESELIVCSLSEGTPPFEVELRPDAGDKVSIDLILVVRGMMVLMTNVSFRVGSAAQPPAPVPVHVSFSAISSAPGVDVVLFHGKNGDLFSSMKGKAGGATPTAWASNILGPTVAALRGQLNELSRSYSARLDENDPFWGLAIEKPQDMLFEFARAGSDLHRALFRCAPTPDDRAKLEMLRESLEQLSGYMQIYVPDFVPWSILYDGPKPKKAEDVDVRRFWGHRFRICRAWDSTLRAVPPAILGEGAPLSMRACIDPHLAKEQGPVCVENQVSFFEKLGGALIGNETELHNFLKTPDDPCNFLYFFCHADVSGQLDDLKLFNSGVDVRDSKIWLDQQAISVDDMQEYRKSNLPGKPLVFMNACSSAKPGLLYMSPFIELFMGKWSAAGFIGTDWKVPTVFADAFGRLVLTELLKEGKTIAEAFHCAQTIAFEKYHNPFPLIYALYGRPDLVVRRAMSGLQGDMS